MADDRPIFDPNRMAVHKKTPAIPRDVTVSRLNAIIKNLLTENLPTTIRLVGEISNFTRAGSGHLYLTLKDARSEIRAVMWRSATEALKFKPADGMEVIATGHIDVYAPRGQYQFYVRKLEPKGVGALELAFRQLRQKLEAEGLFDPNRKKTIPRIPGRIAVVTSETGAAIRDILQTLGRRFPCATVLLYPVRVQGDGAAEQIANAINHLNRQVSQLGGIDVMIIGRGGGSLEDLWAFNEECVARAIFASAIPVISAVGHEVDITISDLVADLRAATPTAAAELAVPVLDDLLDQLSDQADRLRRAQRHRIDLARSRLETATRFEWFRDPLSSVRRHDQRIDEVSSRLRLSWSKRTTPIHRRLNEMEILLSAIRPTAFLQRQQDRLIRTAHRLRWSLHHRLRHAERRWLQSRHQLLLASPQTRLNAHRVRLEQLPDQMARSLDHRIRLKSQTLNSLGDQLEATSHHRTLARGFTLTRDPAGQIITRADQVTPGDEIATETASGSFTSEVSKTTTTSEPRPD